MMVPIVQSWESMQPTGVELRDALTKGLGRAYLWATRGRPLEFEAVREACTRDLIFDQQIDEVRGHWLWRIVEAAGLIDAVREPVWEALQGLEKRSANQLGRLAERFATKGDVRFGDKLRRIVTERPIAEEPYVGDVPLLDLDGEQGLLFVVRVRGKELESRGWEWHDEAILHQAGERFGIERVSESLRAAADGDAAIRRFCEAWRTWKEQNPAHPQRRDLAERTPLSVAEVLAGVESGGLRDSRLRSWGRNVASDADLGAVATRLFESDDAVVIANLLSVFTARALPDFDARLLALCDDRSPETRRRAYMAAANIRHSEVRRFALERLDQPISQRGAVEMLVRNYQRGDERLVVSALTLPTDSCELHWLLMDAFKLLEENPEADSRALGDAIYAYTPCASCRGRTVKLLMERGSLREWMREECRYDAEPDTRALTGGPAWEGDEEMGAK